MCGIRLELLEGFAGDSFILLLTFAVERLDGLCYLLSDACVMTDEQLDGSTAGFDASAGVQPRSYAVNQVGDVHLLSFESCHPHEALQSDGWMRANLLQTEVCKHAVLAGERYYIRSDGHRQ